MPLHDYLDTAIKKQNNVSLQSSDNESPEKHANNTLIDKSNSIIQQYINLDKNVTTPKKIVTSEELAIANKENKIITDDTNFLSLALENQIRKANEQHWLEQLGNSLGQIAINEFGIGTIKAFSDIFGWAVEQFENKEKRDYNNPISKYLEGVQDKVKNELLPIYRESPNAAWDVNDFGWWADNFVSVGTTLSLMLPSKGIVSGFGKLTRLGKVTKGAARLSKTMHYNALSGFLGKQVGKLARSAKNLNWSDNTINALRIQEIGTDFSTALLSRIAENTQEARQVYNDGKNEVLSELNNMSEEEKNKFKEKNGFTNLSDDEIAARIASTAANSTFKNDMGLILFDFIQLRAISKFLKANPSVKASKVVKNYNRDAAARIKEMNRGVKAVINEKALKLTPKEWFGDKVVKFGESVLTNFSEGLEEGWQGIQQEKNKDIISNYFKEKEVYKTFDDYLDDPEITSQMFWGVVGGITFGATAKGVGRIGQRVSLKKDKKLSDTERKLFELGADKVRIDEINARTDKFNTLLDNIDTINHGHLPENDSRRANKNGDVYELDDAQKQFYITEYIQNFVQEIALDSAAVGNVDLLYEWISSPEVQEYFKQHGDSIGFDVSGINAKTIQDVVSRYYDNLTTIYKASPDFITSNIAELYAKALTRAQTTKNKYDSYIRGLEEQLEDELYKSNVTNWSPEFLTKLMLDSTLGNISKLGITINSLIDAYREFIDSVSAGNIDLSKQKPYSSIGLNNQIYSIGRQINGLIDNILLGDNVFGEKFNDNYDLITQAFNNIKELVDGLNVDNASERISKIHELISTISNSYESLSNDFNTANLLSSVIDICKDIVETKTARSKLLSTMPSSDKDIKHGINSLINDITAMFNQWDNKYYRAIKSYIEKAENIDDAATKLLSGQVKNDLLNEALEFYNIGSGDTALGTGIVLKIIDAEKKNRAKKKNTNPIDTATEAKRKASESTPASSTTSTPSSTTPSVSSTPSSSTTPTSSTTPISPTSSTSSTSSGSAETSTTESAPTPTVNNEDVTNEDILVSPIDDTEEAISEADIEGFESFNDIVSQELSDADLSYINDEGENFTKEELITFAISDAINKWIKEGSVDKSISGAIARLIDSGQGQEGMDELIDKILEVLNQDEHSIELLEGITEDNKKKYIALSIHNILWTNYENAKMYGVNTDNNTRYMRISKNLLAKYKFDKETSRFKLLTNEDKYPILKKALDEYSKKVHHLPKNSNRRQLIGARQFLKSVFDDLVENGYNASTIYQVLDFYLDLLTDICYKDTKISREINDAYQIIDTDDILNTRNKLGIKEKSKQLKMLINELSINTDIEGADIQKESQRFAISNTFSKLSDKAKAKILNGGKSIKFNLRQSSNGIIELFFNDGESDIVVGILSPVEANSDNTGFKLEHPSAKSINESVTKDSTGKYILDGELGEVYENLINGALKPNDDSDRKAFNFLYAIFGMNLPSDSNSATIKQQLYPTTDDTIAFLLNKNVMKYAVSKGFNYDIESLRKNQCSVKDKYTARDIAKKLNSIIFYDFYKSSIANFVNEANYDSISKSYQEYAKSVYDNFKTTLAIQKALEEGRPYTINYETSNISSLNYVKGEQVPVSHLQIKSTISEHPLIVFTSEDVGIDEFGNTHKNPAKFKAGTIGILLEDVKAPMIALAVDHTTIKEAEDTPLGKAYIKAIESIFTKYYNDPISEESFNELYENLKSLLGKGSVFKGYGLTKNDNNIIISKITHLEETGKVKYEPIITFYKYDAIADRDDNNNFVWRTRTSDGTKGEIIANPTIGKYTILDYRKSKTRKPSTELIKNMVEMMTEYAIFSDNVFRNNTINKGKPNTPITNDSRIVSFDFAGTSTKNSTNKTNSFKISIKDAYGKELLPAKNREYKSFAHFIVDNNLYSTTHIGRNTSQVYTNTEGTRIEQNMQNLNAVYAKINIGDGSEVSDSIVTFTTIIENKITDNGKFKDRKQIKMPIKEALQLAGYKEDEIEKIIKLNELLRDSKEKGKVIPNFVNFNRTVHWAKDISEDDRKDANNSSYAVRHRTTGVTIYYRGLEAIRANKNELLRLLLHEQLHQNIEDSNFLLDPVYGEARTNQLIKTFDAAYDALKKEIDSGNNENKDIFDTLEGIRKTYGVLLKEESLKSRASFANEWIAEVYSQPIIANYLNTITFTGETLKGKSRSKPSILQKILDIILEFFEMVGAAINPTSVLNEIRNIMGYEGTIEDNISSNETNIPLQSQIEDETIKKEKDTINEEENKKVTEIETSEVSPDRAYINNINDNKVYFIDEYGDKVYFKIPSTYTEKEDRINYADGFRAYIYGEENKEDNEAFNAGYLAAIEKFSDGENSRFPGIYNSDEVTTTKPADTYKNTFSSTDEAIFDALDVVPEISPMGYKRVADMNLFLDRFSPSERPIIEENLKAGAIQYKCNI